MAQKSLEDALKNVGNPVEMLRNSQIGAYVYPVVPAEFTNWRDEQARLAQDLRCCSTSRTTWSSSTSKGPDALKLVSEPRDQQLRELPGQPRQAIRAVQLQRPRHRRRHPVSPRGEQAGVRRPRAVGELDSVPRRDRRLQREDRATTTARPATRRARRSTAIYYRFQIQGPNAWKVIEKLNGGPVPDIKFFHMDAIKIARPQGARAAPRHGGRAGPRDLGPLRRARRDPRRRSSRPARSSGFARSAPAPTPPTRSSRAGFPRRCRPSTPTSR